MAALPPCQRGAGKGIPRAQVVGRVRRLTIRVRQERDEAPALYEEVRAVVPETGG